MNRPLCLAPAREPRGWPFRCCVAVREAIAESEKIPLEADPMELKIVAENMTALSDGTVSDVDIPDDKDQTPRAPYSCIYLP